MSPSQSRSGDLFERSAEVRRLHQPLAERMRPRSLSEVVGQGHLLGEDGFFAVLGQRHNPPSMILWGPPGTGKTTLARLLSERIGAFFAPMSAVGSGVKDVRETVQRARDRQVQYGTRTLLFLDEIHRFSKAQQDSLLPHVESGVVTLVGATTENPSFHVNSALLSRCRVVRLEKLSQDDLGVLLARALADSDRGLGGGAAGDADFEVDDDAREALVKGASGDARRLLLALEVAVAGLADGNAIGRADIDRALQHKTLVYDKAGDEHYGVVSAFIKSMRGSDPDAAVYWMTRMLEAGEDPLFILRRMVIFASEDIGCADPSALSVATAALASFRFIGLPEGVLPMTQCVIHLATSPKSNTALSAYAAARKAVLETGSLPVPNKLLNASSGLAKAMGHGKSYKYPHNFDGNYVAEDYLPDVLVGQRFYQPSDSGHEQAIGEQLAAQRDED